MKSLEKNARVINNAWHKPQICVYLYSVIGFKMISYIFSQEDSHIEEKVFFFLKLNFLNMLIVG